jgi:hypothetical protein
VHCHHDSGQSVGKVFYRLKPETCLTLCSKSLPFTPQLLSHPTVAGAQLFVIPPPLQWVRFLKLRIVSLWGGSGSNGGAGGGSNGPASAAEPYAFSFVYCTLTSIEIFGQTMLQARRRRRDNHST